MVEWQKASVDRPCCQSPVADDGHVTDKPRSVVIVAYPDVQSLDVTGSGRGLRRGQPVRRPAVLPAHGAVDGRPADPDVVRPRPHRGRHDRRPRRPDRHPGRGRRRGHRGGHDRRGDARLAPLGRRPQPAGHLGVQRLVRARRGRAARRPAGHDRTGRCASSWPTCSRPCRSTPTGSSSATGTSGPRPASPPGWTSPSPSSRTTTAAPLALRVARQLVLFTQRSGGQSQFSAQLAVRRGRPRAAARGARPHRRPPRRRPVGADPRPPGRR